MSTALKDYTAQDFDRYYTGAWLLHPTTGDVCRLMAVVENACVFNGQDGTPLPSVPYGDLSFSSFLYRLGYRHTGGGSYLYYITRRALRQASRGLRENTVSVAMVPELTKLHTAAGTSSSYRRQALWTGELIAEALKPSFVPLDVAVSLLKEDTSTVGLALAHSFAITVLSTHTDTPFVILFKGQRAALSVDGSVWKPTNAEYVGVLKRGLPSLILENV